MDQSGRKSITIDAPVIITNNKIAVWLDENWMHKFFDFIKKNSFNTMYLYDLNTVTQNKVGKTNLGNFPYHLQMM